MEERKNIPEIRFKGFDGEWEERKIAELGDVVTGSTPSTQEPLYYSNEGIPWVTPTDITENITYFTAKHLTEEGQKVSRIVPKNTVLITCIASIGKNTILGTIGSFNQQINGLIPNEKFCDPYFLFTESTLWANEMKRSAASGTMQIVNKTEFSQLETFIPIIEEQSQIGSFFQNLDKQFTLEQQKYDKLVTLKKAMLEKMFPKEGEDVPEIRFKGFEGVWDKDELGKLTDVYDGTHQTPNYLDKGVMFLSVENIKTLKSEKFISVEDFSKDFKTYPQKGDVLMTRIGDIGTANVVESNEPLAYYVSLTLLKHKFLNPYYLNACLSSSAVTEDIWHRTLHIAFPKKINMYEIKRIAIPFPNINEQTKIGSYFQNLDKLISLQQKKIDKLKNIKKACLEKMFV